MASKGTFINFSRMFSDRSTHIRPNPMAKLLSLVEQLNLGKTLCFEPSLAYLLEIKVWFLSIELHCSKKIDISFGKIEKAEKYVLGDEISVGEESNNSRVLEIIPHRLSVAEIIDILGLDFRQDNFLFDEPIIEVEPLQLMSQWEIVVYNPLNVVNEESEYDSQRLVSSWRQSEVLESGGTTSQAVPMLCDEMRVDSPLRNDPISPMRDIDPVPGHESEDWDDDEPLIFRRAHLTKHTTTQPPKPKHTKPVSISSPKQTPLTTRTPFTRSKGPAPVVHLPTNFGDDLPKSPPRKTPSKIKTSKAGSSKRKQPAHAKESSEDEIVDLTVKRGKKKLKLEDDVELMSREQYFSQRPLLRGKVINKHHFSSPALEVFLHKLQQQGWLDCFLDRSLRCCESMVVEFYVNCCVEDGIVRSCVHGTVVEFDDRKLGEWLGVPVSGFDSYVKDEQLSDDAHAHFLELCHHYGHLDVGAKSENVPKSAMLPLHRLLYWFIIKCIVPRAQRRHEAEYMDLILIEKIVSEEPVNLPALMIKHIHKIASMRKNHSLGYGFLLTSVFQKLGIKLGHWTTCSHNDEISKTTLMACGFEAASSSVLGNMGITSDEVQRLREDNAKLKEEVAVLKALNSTLKEQLDEAKALNAKYLDHLFSSLNRPPSSAP